MIYGSQQLSCVENPFRTLTCSRTVRSTSGVDRDYLLPLWQELSSKEVGPGYSTPGLVKFELVGSQYIVESIGEPWFGVTRTAAPDVIMLVYPQHVEGTVLFQLLADHRLKAEAFPGLRASQVNGFTEEAKIYER